VPDKQNNGTHPFTDESGRRSEYVNVEKYLGDLLLERVNGPLGRHRHEQFDLFIPPFAKVAVGSVKA
jgi:hypothetical protein